MAAAMHVIGIVADFGEDLCANLLGGEVVSNDPSYAQFSDVFVHKRGLAVQVKMCNSRHAHRPTVAQIETLNEEIGKIGFVASVRKGVYALIFYKGIMRGADAKHPGKSKLLSRKINGVGKRFILANELQFIYIIDARLMHHLATDSHFSFLRRSSRVKVCADRKLRWILERPVLYLNRMFLRGFINGGLSEISREALQVVFGRHGWGAVEHGVSLRFHGRDADFEKTIPVRIIGSKSTVRMILDLMKQGRIKAMPLYERNDPTLQI